MAPETQNRHFSLYILMLTLTVRNSLLLTLRPLSGHVIFAFWCFTILTVLCSGFWPLYTYLPGISQCKHIGNGISFLVSGWSLSAICVPLNESFQLLYSLFQCPGVGRHTSSTNSLWVVRTVSSSHSVSLCQNQHCRTKTEDSTPLRQAYRNWHKLSCERVVSLSYMRTIKWVISTSLQSLPMTRCGQTHISHKFTLSCSYRKLVPQCCSLPKSTLRD